MTYLKIFFNHLGEKIGVEYLYSQTGKVLQEVALDDEELNKDEDEDEDEDTDDEGFHVRSLCICNVFHFDIANAL
jgi:hypothetical protein